MSSLKAVQDKLAIEANEFQALQKGTKHPARRSLVSRSFSFPPMVSALTASFFFFFFQI
jgi:hypothetical protein|tara:strand:- start:1904 stop:2080 length:177 start_codon:yes stop_codon:yes gene_type:complete